MLKENGYYVKFASTLYSSKIVGYGDKIKFLDSRLEGDVYPSFTLKTEANVTFNTLKNEIFTLTLDSVGKIFIYDASYTAREVLIGSLSFPEDSFTDNYTEWLSTTGVFRNSTLLAVNPDSTSITIYWFVPLSEQPPGGSPPGGIPQPQPSPPSPPPPMVPIEPTPINLVLVGVVVIVGVVLFAAVSGEESTLLSSRRNWKRNRSKTKKPKWKRVKNKLPKWKREKEWE